MNVAHWEVPGVASGGGVEASKTISRGVGWVGSSVWQGVAIAQARRRVVRCGAFAGVSVTVRHKPIISTVYGGLLFKWSFADTCEVCTGVS
jgi:hypothetical protein